MITTTLSLILDEHLETGRKIDLLTVDVEGHDFQVLQGLDFDRYRPAMIIAEMHRFEGIQDTSIYQFLTGKGYVLKYFAIFSAYFIDAEH